MDSDTVRQVLQLNGLVIYGEEQKNEHTRTLYIKNPNAMTIPMISSLEFDDSVSIDRQGSETYDGLVRVVEYPASLSNK